jgi:hypothetical protein
VPSALTGRALSVFVRAAGGKDGREGGEAAADWLGGRPEPARELQPPRVASSRLAQPRGLWRHRLVTQLQRRHELGRLGADALDQTLGMPRWAGPGAIAVPVM